MFLPLEQPELSFQLKPSGATLEAAGALAPVLCTNIQTPWLPHTKHEGWLTHKM